MSDINQVKRQIELFLEDGARERLTIALAILDLAAKRRSEQAMSEQIPTIDEVRAFLHKQIAEVRATGKREGEDVTERIDDMLDQLHDIDQTHAYIEQTIGDRAAAAWVPTVMTALAAKREAQGKR